AGDANIERSRAMSDSLKSLEDALRELIQKMLSTMDAIQQSTNQTRTKILG
ncbi:MAG: type III secretion system protein, partial [Desulfovibrionales bacterium]|nr:type III secretion system protein [Desulfovibrionales bacterium]